MGMAKTTTIQPFDPFKQAGSSGPRWTRGKTRLEYNNRWQLAVTKTSYFFTSPDRLFKTSLLRLWHCREAETRIFPSQELTVWTLLLSQSLLAKQIDWSVYYASTPSSCENCGFGKYSIDENINAQGTIVLFQTWPLWESIWRLTHKTSPWSRGRDPAPHQF